MPDVADLPTQTLLLDTAEAMFSRLGFDGVSMRELTRQAGTNLASVNYHFGSKEKLFHAVIHRRIGPMNDRRRAGLRQVLDRAGDARPDLAAVLDAFARPAVLGMGSAGHDSLRLIVVRLFTAADPLVKPIIEREFAPLGREFVAAIARACPDLTPQQVHTGFVFYLGAMINLLNRFLIQQFNEAPPDEEQTLRMLVRFGVAGFASLATEPPARGRKR